MMLHASKAASGPAFTPAPGPQLPNEPNVRFGWKADIGMRARNGWKGDPDVIGTRDHQTLMSLAANFTNGSNFTSRFTKLVS